MDMHQLEQVLGQKTLENEILREAVKLGREKKLISRQPLQGISETTPFSEEVSNNYKIDNERIQIANYHTDLIMEKLKGSL